MFRYTVLGFCLLLIISIAQSGKIWNADKFILQHFQLSIRYKDALADCKNHSEAMEQNLGTLWNLEDRVSRVNETVKSIFETGDPELVPSEKLELLSKYLDDVDKIVNEDFFSKWILNTCLPTPVAEQFTMDLYKTVVNAEFSRLIAEQNMTRKYDSALNAIMKTTELYSNAIKVGEERRRTENMH